MLTAHRLISISDIFAENIKYIAQRAYVKDLV